VIRSSFHPSLELLLGEYKDLVPSGFKNVERKTFDMRVEYDFENLIGYLSTWSPLNNYKQSHPDAEDPLVVTAKKYVFLTSYALTRF
jgi:hypothetical protein